MKYIALLRAVNVGGRHKIKMADLRDTLAGVGLDHVRTYIQSGNILFESNAPQASLHTRITNSIEERFGFPVDLVLRTVAELADIIENSPFLEPAESEESPSGHVKLYVALLQSLPGHGALQRLEQCASEQERYRVVGRDIYLYLNQGMRHSKLAPQVHNLSVPVTVRNWKTLTKLHAMANDTSRGES